MAQVARSAASLPIGNLWELPQPKIEELNRETLKEINCTDLNTIKALTGKVKGNKIRDVFDNAFPKAQGQSKKRGKGRKVKGGGSSREGQAVEFLDSLRQFRKKLVKKLGEGAKDPRICAIVEAFKTIPAANKSNAFAVMNKITGPINLSHLVMQLKTAIEKLKKERAHAERQELNRRVLQQQGEEFHKRVREQKVKAASNDPEILTNPDDHYSELFCQTADTLITTFSGFLKVQISQEYRLSLLRKIKDEEPFLDLVLLPLVQTLNMSKENDKKLAKESIEEYIRRMINKCASEKNTLLYTVLKVAMTGYKINYNRRPHEGYPFPSKEQLMDMLMSVSFQEAQSVSGST